MHKVAMACAVICGFCVQFAYAGAANADLDCKAINARDKGLTLSGSVPGDFSEFNLKLQKAQHSVVLEGGSEHIEIVIDFKKRQFKLRVQRASSAALALTAIPSTIKYKGGRRDNVVASFDAKLLQAPNPMVKSDAKAPPLVRNVRMQCKFKHEI